MINTKMFARIQRQIESDPGSHDQDSYETESWCGTTRCIAGWAIHFDLLDMGQHDPVRVGSHPRVRECTAVGLRSEAIFDTARAILGLDNNQAMDLFYCWDSAEALEKVRGYAALDITATD